MGCLSSTQVNESSITMESGQVNRPISQGEVQKTKRQL